MFVLFLLALVAHSFCEGNVCDDINVRKRDYLEPSKSQLPSVSSAGTIIIGQTGGETCKVQVQCRNVVRNLQKSDTDRNLVDIADNFLIGGDGNVYEGRGWQKKNERYDGEFQRALSIAFIGDYNGKNVTEEMADAAFKLIQCGVTKSKIQYYASIYTYADVKCGLNNTDNGLQNEVKKWFRYAAAGRLSNC